LIYGNKIAEKNFSNFKHDLLPNEITVVYWNGKLLEDIDVASFEVLKDPKAKGKNHQYGWSEITE
jgi:hypothetical protein